MIELTPQPGPQTIFMRCNEDEVLYGGAKGGGKSYVLLLESLRQANNPNYKALILRRTYPRLQELIDRSKMIFPKLGATYSGSEHTWTFPTGSKIRFGHCQNVGDEINYQGHEYQYLGFDQLEEFLESQYLFLCAQVRTSDPSLKCYVRSSANPGGVGHAWVKGRWIDNKEPYKTYRTEFNVNGHTVIRTSCFVPATIFDNQVLLKANPTYLANLSSLPDRTRKALLDGSWDIFEGQYFTEFDRNVHVIKTFTPPKEWRRVIAGDYGFSAPSAVYWAALSPNGDIYVYRELYKNNLTFSALKEEIRHYTLPEEVIDYQVFDPSIWAKHGGTGQTGAELLAGDDVILMKADNDRIAGWIRLREYLKDPKGNPHIFFTENCVNLIRTLPSLVHDNIRQEDIDTYGEDHAGDAIRYLVMSRPRPKEVKAPHRFEGKSAWQQFFAQVEEQEALKLRNNRSPNEFMEFFGKPDEQSDPEFY